MDVRLTQFIALFLLLLVAGVFWGNWVSLTRSMGVFSAVELIRLAKILVRNLAIPMRIISPVCIGAMVLSMWMYPNKESVEFYVGIAAIVFILAALLITILIEVPINNQIIAWTPSTVPANWEAIRNRWQFFNIIRVVAALMSFGCFALTIL